MQNRPPLCFSRSFARNTAVQKEKLSGESERERGRWGRRTIHIYILVPYIDREKPIRNTPTVVVFVTLEKIHLATRRDISHLCCSPHRPRPPPHASLIFSLLYYRPPFKPYFKTPAPSPKPTSLYIQPFRVKAYLLDSIDVNI